MRKIQRALSGILLVQLLLSELFAVLPVSHAAGTADVFDPARIIEDSAFLARSSMSVQDIQEFLIAKGSFLAQFSENGRTASQIVFDAAQGRGDAAGNCSGSTTCFGVRIDETTGTVSPKVLLVALQKEQSLVTSSSPSQAALDRAMGYGCPDGGGCNDAFKGFSKQVENAAWQLRFNFERATRSEFSDYKVGQTMTFTNSLDPFNPPPTQQVTIANAATASLYRYTPHVYNGNYNFWKLFRDYFVQFSAQVVSRNGNRVLAAGSADEFTVVLKNTGETTWTPSTVYLGTARTFDRIPGFLREDRVSGKPSGWVSSNRVVLKEASVPPGSTGTFSFYYTVPQGMSPGLYREFFQPVADGVTWFDDLNLSWDILVPTLDESFRATVVNRSANLRLIAGQSGKLSVQLKNTGLVTWKQGTVNLGTDRNQDRTPRFIREDIVDGSPSGWLSPNRVVLAETQVTPGEVGTFTFYYSVPNDLTPGLYREFFRPVHEQLGWLPDGRFDLSWDVTVLPANESTFTSQWIGQTANPTLTPGQSQQFEVKFTNTSPIIWKQGTVNLGTDRNQDRIPGFLREDTVGKNPSGWVSPNRVRMLEGQVKPGETGTFQFYYTVPTNKPAGTYREYFRLVADPITWMNDLGVFWDITVQ